MTHPQNYYHSSTQSSRIRDGGDIKREERLPSLRHVVGDVYGSGTSPYNFHDVKRSLPHVSNDPYSRHSGYNEHEYSRRGPTLPPIQSGHIASHHTYPSHSTSSHSSTPRHPSHNPSSHHTGTTSASSSSRTRPNTEYPSDQGHTYEAFYSSRDGLVSLSTSSRPHGVIRSSEVPVDYDDPRKKHKCLECGKGFDRPSGLEQHQTRHTGDRPYPCTVQGCNKSFTVRSNMTRHVRTQHCGESDDADHFDDRGPTRYTHSRGSSDKSSSSSVYYSSSRRS